MLQAERPHEAAEAAAAVDSVVVTEVDVVVAAEVRFFLGFLAFARSGIAMLTF